MYLHKVWVGITVCCLILEDDCYFHYSSESVLISQSFVKASDYAVLFQQPPRMTLKTDAGRTLILRELNGVAAEMLDWQEHQHAFGFFPLFSKKCIEYYRSF